MCHKCRAKFLNILWHRSLGSRCSHGVAEGMGVGSGDEPLAAMELAGCWPVAGLDGCCNSESETALPKASAQGNRP